MLTYKLRWNEREAHKRTINAQENLKVGLGKLVYERNYTEGQQLSKR
jgi:hypothetical protein